MAGVVETSHTFLTDEVITSQAMNDIIDETTFTADALANGTLAITAGKLKVATSGITSNEVAVDSITTNAIVNLNVTGAKVAEKTLTASKVADNTLTALQIANETLTALQIANATITAAKLNGAQTGNAPIYGCRAWVNFNGATASNLTGTYARSGTTVTVTISNHGLLVGHQAFLDFTSGLAADGLFTVTSVANVNTFTVTHVTSGATSGNVTLQLRQIRGSGNISNVGYVGFGNYIVNFTTALPSDTYQVNGTASGSAAHPVVAVSQAYDSTATTSSLRIYTSTTGGGGSNGFLFESNHVNVSIFG